ncbi:hypothetical protein K461DRAFT_55525 [Myriangium duriaei CBS 260.36]|uniref:Uncharacterized protein n=1 Tax=Myriangium duriaei CBS 260.36 TaxID=1168546 RepID=A0A9P4ISP0_9PEZI|nr:hypothetical protein K461DRAFT_55525 [Myriangium duriaei CBS 260.36]
MVVPHHRHDAESERQLRNDGVCALLCYAYLSHLVAFSCFDMLTVVQHKTCRASPTYHTVWMLHSASRVKWLHQVAPPYRHDAQSARNDMCIVIASVHGNAGVSRSCQIPGCSYLDLCFAMCWKISSYSACRYIREI